MKDPAHRDSPDKGTKRLGRFLWIAGLALVYTLPLFTLHGDMEIFLKIDKISGESQDAKHKNEIDVLAWSWGMSQSGSFHVGGGGGAGKANFQDLFFTKYIDKATPQLMLHCANGKHIPEATLTVRKDPATQPEEYLVITMKDVYITSYQTGGSAGAVERPEENIRLGYGDYIQQVFTFDPMGDVIDEFEVFWNVPTNTGGGNELVTNTAPTITAVTAQTTSEDGPPVVVNFTIGDAETPAGALILGRSSGNPVLVPNGNVVFSGAGTSRTATITPAPDQFGSTDLTLTVSDGSMSASTSFSMTVTPVNDPPSVTPVPSQITEQDVDLDVAITLGDIDDTAAGLLLTATSDNPAVLSNASITVPATGNPRVITLTPEPGASGDAVVTLIVVDNLGLSSLPQSFLFTVNGASSGIDFISLDGLPPGEPIFVAENSPANTPLGLLVTAIPPDPAVTFTLLDDAGGRFGIEPGTTNALVVTNGSLLDFETAPLHTIKVQASDPAGGTRTEILSIELTNVNEPPLVAVPANFGTAPPNRLWDLGGIAINDPDSDPNSILATFSVTNGQLHVTDALLPGATITGDGTATVVITAPASVLNTMLSTFAGLTYRSDPTFTGTETVTITTDDQGANGVGGALTGAASATLVVESTPWHDWRLLHFSGTQLDDLSISGFYADPDHEGLSNGVEYGIGSDPWDAADGPGKVLVASEDFGGIIFPVVVFPRRISDPSLSVEVEVATNLHNWSAGPAFTFEQGANPIDPDFDEPTIRSLWDIPSNPTQQFRLRFSLNTP